MHLGFHVSTVREWHINKHTTRFPSVSDGKKIVRVQASKLDEWFPWFCQHRYSL